MEYLASDIKNIKNSLIRMHKYILDKAIEGDKINSVKDLEGIRKAAWEFILSLYEAHWDSLIVDDFKMLFRNKIKSKLSPQIVKASVNIKGKESIKLTYISPLLPSIPVKSPKEVNKISKYFKKNPLFAQKKSYAQVSFKPTISNIAIEILKIKEAFLNFQNKKIEQVQKLISGDSKPKPHINITTKRPLCKQVIVPININNTRKFINNSSTHIININRAPKSIKSNVMADFIQINDKDIVISTNNVTSSLDLQEIKRCIKNSLCVEAN